MQYVALLRGINVGGNNKVPMADLRTCLQSIGAENVRTYIQSGNVVFTSNSRDETTLTAHVEQAIEKQFGFPIIVALFSQAEFEYIADHVPKRWLKNPEWKYNYLFLKKPTTAEDALQAMGELRADIEAAVPGHGVVYQGISIKFFGRTTAGKIISKPIYKQMTIRNHNTVRKLLDILHADQSQAIANNHRQ